MTVRAPLEENDLFMAEAEGFRTLVGGLRGEPPFSHGNCFGVFYRKNEYRVINFYAENLDELRKLGLKWPIQCRLLSGRIAIIHDPRIGERWYRDRYCETCCPQDMLPITQRQRQERDVMRGWRKEHEKFVELKFGQQAEFP